MSTNKDNKSLTPEQHYVTQEHGTEPAFSGKYNDTKIEGVYNCACCGEKLFSSSSKFDSGTGWPSFSEPISDSSIGINQDLSMGMSREEVHCQKCDAHLGHVFPDGPEPTGLRYCINSVSLDLKSETQEED